MNKQPEKKTTVFTKKICKFKTSYYLCNTKFQRWIHLRVRIHASHAWYTSSILVPTTKTRKRLTDETVNRFLFFIFLL